MRELRPLPSARLFVLIDRCLLGACWPVTCLADSRCLFTVADRCLLDRGFLPLEELLRKPHVCLGAFRSGVVKKDRLAETRSFTQPDTPRDNSVVGGPSKELPDVIDNLVGKIRPFIEHCQDDSENLE